MFGRAEDALPSLRLGGLNGRNPPRFTACGCDMPRCSPLAGPIERVLLLGGVNGLNPPRFTGSGVRFIPEFAGGATNRAPLLLGGVNGLNPPRFTGSAVRFMPELVGPADPLLPANGLYPLRLGACVVRFTGLLIVRPPPCNVPALGFCTLPIPPRIAVD